MSARKKKRATIKDLEARVRALEAKVEQLDQEAWMHRPIGPVKWPKEPYVMPKALKDKLDELARESQNMGLYDPEVVRKQMKENEK